jgi:hypothetical protein
VRRLHRTVTVWSATGIACSRRLKRRIAVGKRLILSTRAHAATRPSGREVGHGQRMRRVRLVRGAGPAGIYTLNIWLEDTVIEVPRLEIGS